MKCNSPACLIWGDTCSLCLLITSLSAAAQPFLRPACFCLVCFVTLICYYLLLQPPSFSTDFIFSNKDAIPSWHALKSCASAPVRLGVCACVRRSGSSLGPNLYIIPSDGASERQTGSGWPPGVSLLNEISAPLTRALLLSPFCQENRNDLRPPRDLWAATVFLQVATRQPRQTSPKPPRRSVEVRPRWLDGHRGVKWRVNFRGDVPTVLEKGDTLSHRTYRDYRFIDVLAE